MNEQIKDLAARAKFLAEEEINRKISHNKELEVFAEKLTELIIKDVAKFVDAKLEMTRYGNEVPDRADGDDILAHYGISVL